MTEQNRKRARGAVILPNQNNTEVKPTQEKEESKKETKLFSSTKIFSKPQIKNEILIPTKQEVKQDTKIETKKDEKEPELKKSTNFFSKLFSTPKKTEEKKSVETRKESVIVKKGEETKTFKLLLLGSGESGKSTLFKQIKGLYEKEEYSEEENYNNLLVIYSNILHDIRRLCMFCLQQEIPFEKDENIEAAKEIIKFTEPIDHTGLRNLEDYTVQIHSKVKQLWSDTNLLDRFIKNRYELQLFDGAQ